MFLQRSLKKEFIPSQDQSRFLVTITNPLGVSLDSTDALSKEQMEPWLMQQPKFLSTWRPSADSRAGSEHREHFRHN